MGERLRPYTRQVKTQLGQVTEFARQYSEQVIDSQRHTAATKVRGFSGAIRQTAHRLHEDKDDHLAHYVDAVADQLDHAGDYLVNASPNQLFDDMASFTRRNPELVLGGMFLGGLLLGRFLKAGVPPREELGLGSATGGYDVDSDFSYDDDYDDEQLRGGSYGASGSTGIHGTADATGRSAGASMGTGLTSGTSGSSYYNAAPGTPGTSSAMGGGTGSSTGSSSTGTTGTSGTQGSSGKKEG